MKAWLAVRCCCQPQKIIGFLPVNEESMRVGIMNVTSGKRSIFSSENVSSAPKVLYEAAMRHHQVELKIYGMGELAVYSDDKPIDFWRTIDNFVEAGK